MLPLLNVPTLRARPAGAHASARSPSASALGEVRPRPGADRAAASGWTACWTTTPTSSTPRPSSACWPPGEAARGRAGRARTRALRAAAADAGRAAPSAGRVERHRAALPAGLRLHELFEAQARAHAGRRRGGLRRRGADLRRPRTRGPTSSPTTCGAGVWGRSVRVGSASSARWSWSSALLGVLKAGGASCRSTPPIPPERLAFMLEDAAASRCCSPGSIAGCRRRSAIVVLDDERPENA